MWRVEVLTGRRASANLVLKSTDPMVVEVRLGWREDTAQGQRKRGAEAA